MRPLPIELQPGQRRWGMPQSGPDGSPVMLEDIFTSERAASLFEVFRTG